MCACHPTVISSFAYQCWITLISNNVIPKCYKCHGYCFDSCAHFLRPVRKFTMYVRCWRCATLNQGFANTTKDLILMSGV